MSYTVVGLFRDRNVAEQAKNELENSGFDTDRVDYSTYRSEGEFTEHDYEYRDDERTTGFWDSLFGADTDEYDVDTRNQYSRLGSRSNVISVHTDDLADAERAQSIMDTAGSLDINDYDRRLTDYRNRFNEDEEYNQSFEEFIDTDTTTPSEDYVPSRSRIVNRRIEDDFRLRDERLYQKRNRLDNDIENDDYRGGVL